ncbi:hypothetical protein BDK51DRAFT_40735 [Blyttiomyces helicus]|uniref:Uncharacterized protein n=1 Tax=Blyttiomyces helicus TaxID=388810 RepID=A0A4P9WGU1_9FUNG|nr:hypothetical protein BDK51DRAFT_40735 [Blyttiomyces helicus]|eukprot:RKO89726.1 hypothetical protein BDK51DRAFT_40735 [Blyttiomyces helicus]
MRICGGGGQFRTGRWRPNELFSPGRKLFNISHDHAGMLAYTHQIFSCPPALPLSLASTLDVFWEDRFLKIALEAEFIDAHISVSDLQRSQHATAIPPGEVRRIPCALLKPGRRRYLGVTLVDNCIVEFTHWTGTIPLAVSHACTLEVLESIIADAIMLSVAALLHGVAVGCSEEDEEEDPLHKIIGWRSTAMYLAQQDAERARAGNEPLEPVLFGVKF